MIRSVSERRKMVRTVKDKEEMLMGGIESRRRFDYSREDSLSLVYM